MTSAGAGSAVSAAARRIPAGNGLLDLQGAPLPGERDARHLPPAPSTHQDHVGVVVAASEVGGIEPGLVAEHHPLLEHRVVAEGDVGRLVALPPLDRKSTRLNSSHLGISYAVFCLKKKRNQA